MIGSPGTAGSGSAGTRSRSSTPALPRRIPPEVAPVLRVLPGSPESANTARLLARQVLGDNHPAVETVQLLISELVTNAIMHSESGTPGGTVTVALCPGPAGVLVQVRDNGGPSAPSLTATSESVAEHGYGLLLVDALADCWGTVACVEGRVTWCRVVGDRPASIPAGAK
jgi:anti-sigma regulatory factor (Ser/Thr protein kinase)